MDQVVGREANWFLAGLRSLKRGKDFSAYINLSDTQITPGITLIDGLSTHFPRSNAAATAWGNLVSNFLLLRHLRSFHPMTSVDENGDPYDLSGQGRVLNNTNTLTYASTSLMTYAVLVAASSRYFTRGIDEAGYDITAGLTFGGWYYFNTALRTDGLSGKWNGTGVTNQRSWVLYKTNLAAIRFGVSSGGTAISSMFVNSTITPVDANWYFVVGRYTPSTEIAIWVNGTKTILAVGIPAALFNSTQPYEVGVYRGTPDYLDGRVGPQFVCATALEDCFINGLFWHSAPLFGVKP